MKGNGHDIHALIRLEAYLLSEKAGHPAHMHDHFWSQAETIVRQRAAIVDVAVKAAKKKPAKSLPKAKPAAATKKSAKASKKKLSEPQLPLGEEVPVKKSARDAKPKSAAPAKKKVAPASGKSAAKPK